MTKKNATKRERAAGLAAPLGSAAVELPYIVITRTVTERHYNKAYGDDRLCRCGHKYYRHFDTYDSMAVCGCKYCDCSTFVEGEQPNVKLTNPAAE